LKKKKRHGFKTLSGNEKGKKHVGLDGRVAVNGGATGKEEYAPSGEEKGAFNHAAGRRVPRERGEQSQSGKK